MVGSASSTGRDAPESSTSTPRILHDLSIDETEGLNFVVSTGLEKPHAELRKLIRRKVMLGKNLGKALPPRKTRQKRRQVTERPSKTAAAFINPKSQAHSVHVLPGTVPRMFGTFSSSMTPADVVDPEAVDVILRCKLKRLSVNGWSNQLP